MKIAMLLDEAGRAIGPEGDGTRYVYERQGLDWVVSQSRPHQASNRDTVAAMRAYLTEVCDWLGDCTVLAAERPRGFGRVVFAQRGVDLWAIDGAPENYLDQIDRHYRQKARKARARVLSVG